MFRAKTLLVIGAGASVEVGLPVGADLLKQIVDLVHISFDFHRQEKGDAGIVEALKILLNEGREVKKLNDHLKAGWQLSKSAKQAISIDNVIDALEDPKVELIGKLGIVRAILKAEAKSANFRMPDRHPQVLEMSNFDDTWYSSLTKLITENVKASQIDNIFNNLEIINFNYDRCLEHYLRFSLADYYDVKYEAVEGAMEKLVVHRPYGSAGKLPWQKQAGPDVQFGEMHPGKAAEAAKQIRTFTERVEEEDKLDAIKGAIAGADRIVFLGFAFHRQNIEIIAKEVQEHAEIVATAFGISESDRSVIIRELIKAFAMKGVYPERRITLAATSCHQFFRDYWRTLTAERV
jgi:hypothetical protein